MKAENKRSDQSSGRQDLTQLKRERRPVELTFVFLIFLLWMMLGWLRFSGALTQRALIGTFFPSGTFWYLVVAGLIWGLIGLPVLWGLLFRSAWTIKLLWFAGLLYPALYWFERIFLWKDPGAQKNWPFMLVLTFSWVGLLIWVSRSKRVRQFFMKPPEENEGH